MITELLLSIIGAWMLAKIIKFLQDIIREKRFDLRFIFHDGGIVSAHTTAVVSVTTAIFLEEGLSTAFMVAVVLALIVINDAVKVRWITGEQSKLLNRLNAGKKGYRKLEESVGHRPIEAILGTLVGIVVPILVYSLF